MIQVTATAIEAGDALVARELEDFIGSEALKIVHAGEQVLVSDSNLPPRVTS